MTFMAKISDYWNTRAERREKNDINESFLEAAEKGDYPAMNAYLDRRKDEFTKQYPALETEILTQALMHVTDQGTTEMMDRLIKNGADINCNTWDLVRPCNCGSRSCSGSIHINGATPLIVATDNNDGAAVKLLLENKADPHKVLSNGLTALGLAVSKKYYNIVPDLLKAEGGIDLKVVKPRKPKVEASDKPATAKPRKKASAPAPAPSPAPAQTHIQL